MSAAKENSPGRGSLRVAINAMCKSCIYDPASGLGTWREQVGACSCTRCPLHAVRPLPRYRASPERRTVGGTAITASPTGKGVNGVCHVGSASG